MSNQFGLLSTGVYAQNPVDPVTIAASSVPSYTMVGTVVTNTILEVIPIPPNVIGPDGWLEVFIEWSFTNSANVKTMQLNVDKQAATVSDNQTTGQSSIMRLVISNQNNTSNCVYSAAPVASGNMTAAPNSVSLDFTTEHTLALWGNLANTADSLRIERWYVVAHNPPAHSVGISRMQYGKKMFYGANMHFDDTQSIAMHIAGMKTIGIKLMRIAYEWTSLQTLVNYAQALQADGTGIQMYVCLDLGIGGFANEANAYASTFSAVLPVVQALAPYGVKMFECGNEMDTKAGINVGDPSGGRPTDFSNTLVPLFRGVQRGAIDAVHACGCLAGSNAYTICSIGLSDMMYNGTQPDGSSGWPLVRWDWTAWHNYEDYGPLKGVELGNNRRWVNIYEYLNRQYDVPIIISEWNGKASDTDPQRSNWANRFMYEAFSNRYKYNIAAIIVYELYGSPWALLDGVTNAPISTFGTTVQTFITNNPDTGV